MANLTKAATHERSRYTLTGRGHYVDGSWSAYDITTTDGTAVVGLVSQRSGGGWIATLPVFGDGDTGISIVRIKIGTAFGRGLTPQDALADADRRALEGIIGPDQEETT